MEPINNGQPMVSPELQKKRVLRRNLVVAAVVVVVIAAALLGWWMYKNREVSREIAPGQTLIAAQEGNIVSQFPKELILEKGVAVSESYRIEYAEGGVGQPVAVYDSKMTAAENFAAFKAYFEENEWNIRNEGDPAESSVGFIYAIKDGAGVNVTLEPTPEGTVRVNISYVIKR